MIYKLNHQNSLGNIKTTIEDISYLAFIKHATFAGINTRFFPQLPFRYLSILFEFAPHFWGKNCFKQLPQLFSDPTETAYISNRIGRAFSDYLSKKIYGAKFTHSYECAMELRGHLIAGERPDFYCDTLKKQFAVEAKGFTTSSVSDNAMKNHKLQSTQGPLPVHFSVASVSYNLYRSPNVKFYDPVGDNFPYDIDLNSKLRSMYYETILNFVRLISKEENIDELPNYLSYRIDNNFTPIRKILLHKSIVKRDWENLEWLESIQHIDNPNANYYIDLDGVGLSY